MPVYMLKTPILNAQSLSIKWYGYVFEHWKAKRETQTEIERQNLGRNK